MTRSLPRDCDTETAPHAVVQLMTGLKVAQLITVMSDVGVADHVGDTPTPIAQIADSLKLDRRRLYRALRALAAYGVFQEHPGQQFSHNTLSAPLRSDHPRSIRHAVRWLGAPSMARAWYALGHVLKTGEDGYEHANGTPLFDHIASDPQCMALMRNAFTQFASHNTAPLAEACEFDDGEVVVDVGGSDGTTLAVLLEAHSGIRGVLYDRPDAVERGRATLAERGLGDRVEVITGDFFASVPAGGDTYVLKHVVSDHSDAKCLDLLRAVRRVIKPSGRLLVIGHVIQEGPDQAFVKLLDVTRMVASGGAERTLDEFARLLSQAGFGVPRLRATFPMALEPSLSVIEARPSPAA